MSAAPFKDQVIPCPYIGSGEASERLLEVAATKYRTVSASAERLQFARAYRPLWSTIVGILLIPVLVGIPILLIKSTETWSAAIEEDHRKVQVRITGRILPFVLVQLADALAAAPSPTSARPPAGPTAELGVIDQVSTPPGLVESHLPVGTPLAPPPPTNFIDPGTVFAGTGSAEVVVATPSTTPQTPPAPVPAEVPASSSIPADAASQIRPPAHVGGEVAPDPAPSGEHTVLRGSLPRAGASRSSSSTALMARFDTGQRLTVAGTLLVGRDPEPGTEFVSAELLAIDDTALSVSKTHLVVRFHDGKTEVMDLGSTNGTQIVDPSGKLTLLEPRQAVAVDSGATVKFGDRSFTLAPADEVAHA